MPATLTVSFSKVAWTVPVPYCMMIGGADAFCRKGVLSSPAGLGHLQAYFRCAYGKQTHAAKAHARASGALGASFLPELRELL